MSSGNSITSIVTVTYRKGGLLDVRKLGVKLE